MALEDFREQLKEKISESWSKIQESPAYNNAREKFETLSPGAQRGIIFGTLAFIAALFLSIPMSYFSSASSSVTDYNSTRELLRALLRASRLANEAASLPPSITPEELKSRLQGDLAAVNLLPEQMGGLLDIDVNSLGKSLAPKGINQSAVSLTLKKLNLKQVVDVGYQIQQINPSVKLAGLSVTASSPDPHYFDAIYKVVIYSVPMSVDTESGPGPKGSGGPRGGSAKTPQAPPQFRKAPGGGAMKNRDSEE
jgi:hypothetical protein